MKRVKLKSGLKDKAPSPQEISMTHPRATSIAYVHLQRQAEDPSRTISQRMQDAKDFATALHKEGLLADEA